MADTPQQRDHQAVPEALPLARPLLHEPGDTRVAGLHVPTAIRGPASPNQTRHRRPLGAPWHGVRQGAASSRRLAVSVLDPPKGVGKCFQRVIGHGVLDQREQLPLLQPNVIGQPRSQDMQRRDGGVRISGEVGRPTSDVDVIAERPGDKCMVRISEDGIAGRGTSSSMRKCSRPNPSQKARNAWRAEPAVSGSAR